MKQYIIKAIDHCFKYLPFMVVLVYGNYLANIKTGGIEPMEYILQIVITGLIAGSLTLMFNAFKVSGKLKKQNSQLEEIINLIKQESGLKTDHRNLRTDHKDIQNVLQNEVCGTIKRLDKDLDRKDFMKEILDQTDGKNIEILKATVDKIENDYSELQSKYEEVLERLEKYEKQADKTLIQDDLTMIENNDLPHNENIPHEEPGIEL